MIYNPHNEAAELYDLAEDPGERHNLGSTRKDRVQSMVTAIRDRMRKNDELKRKVAKSNGEALALKQEEVEKLRSLGYVR